jgi:CRP-like cAMP-binding protein
VALMGTDASDRIASLRAIPMFAGLSDEALGRVAETMTEVEAAPGQVLIPQGRAGSGLLVVQQGTVMVERPGKPVIELGPGEFVGELALLTPEGLHTARVRAKGSGVLLAIARSDFARLLEAEPKIAMAVISALAARLAATTRPD